MKRRAVILLAFAGCLLGFAIAKSSVWELPKANPACTYSDLTSFSKQIHKEYLQQIPEEESSPILSAFNGKNCQPVVEKLFSTLDPHSSYYTPEQLKELKEILIEQRFGLGVILSRKKDRFVISYIQPNTAASRLGLKIGDRITMVNGHSINNESSEEVSSLLSGKDGSWVHLVIERGRMRFHASAKRAPLYPPSAEAEMLPGNTLHLTVRYFSEDLPETFVQRLKENPEARGLVIDLRGNGGGLVESAMKLLKVLIPSGVAIRFDSPSYRNQDVPHLTMNNYTIKLPIVVLIDRFSASASELFASSLQDNGRAIIIGERSYGKGTLQRVSVKRGLWAYRLTIEKFHSPNGIPIQGRGVIPDLKCGRGEKVPELNAVNAILASPYFGTTQQVNWITKLGIKCGVGKELKTAAKILLAWREESRRSRLLDSGGAFASLRTRRSRFATATNYCQLPSPSR